MFQFSTSGLPCSFLVALSKETITNLLDVMQKVSLAIVTVSVALFSNALISRTSVEKEPESELGRLMEIRRKMGDQSPRRIVEGALRRVGKRGGSESLIEKIALADFEPSNTIQISFPMMVYDTPNSALEDKPFNQIETLGDLHKAWDIITRKFYILDRPSWMYLQIPDLRKTSKELRYSEVPPSASTVLLEIVGDPKPNDPTAVPVFVWIFYDFSPMLTDVEDQNKASPLFCVGSWS
jgi:hypothetical protein